MQEKVVIVTGATSGIGLENKRVSRMLSELHRLGYQLSCPAAEPRR
ncbi:MAG: hypothetical protein AB1796_09545 [Bacillota bacterium]